MENEYFHPITQSYCGRSWVGPLRLLFQPRFSSTYENSANKIILVASENMLVHDRNQPPELIREDLAGVISEASDKRILVAAHA
jgi:hypothetical protein